MTPRRLAEPDPRVLDVKWSTGVVHLYVNDEEVLSLSPEVAQWLSTNAAVCASAAAQEKASHSRADYFHSATDWLRRARSLVFEKRLLEAVPAGPDEYATRTRNEEDHGYPGHK